MRFQDFFTSFKSKTIVVFNDIYLYSIPIIFSCSQSIYSEQLLFVHMEIVIFWKESSSSHIALQKEKSDFSKSWVLLIMVFSLVLIEADIPNFIKAYVK